MRPRVLLTSILAIALSAGAVDAKAIEKTYETANDLFRYEQCMRKAQKSFDSCQYSTVSVYTRRAELCVETQSLKRRADSLRILAEECIMYRDSAIFFRKRRHFGKAHLYYANVVMRNQKDEECRNGYDTCYIFSHDKYHGMSMIKGGNYTVGRNNGPFCEGPQHTVHLDDFMMDNCEVSVADYAVFLNVSRNMVDGQPCIDIKNPDCHIKEVAGWYYPEKGFEDYPVTCVSYFGAMGYARWIKKDLPDEYQFEAAWGKNTINCNHSNGVMSAKCGAPNEYNIMNLYGNVAEWCKNWFDASMHRNGNKKKKKDGEVYIEELMSVRGCAFDTPEDINPKTFREGLSPIDMYSNVGFRCVINL